jgi:hypothetical protein
VIRARAAATAALLALCGLAGCGSETAQTPVSETDYVQAKLQEYWKANGPKALEEARAALTAGQFDLANTKLSQFAWTNDPAVLSLLNEAEIGLLEARAATLKASQVQDRKDVWTRLATLRPDDTRAAEEARTAQAEMQAIRELSDSALCKALRGKASDRAYANEWARRGGTLEEAEAIAARTVSIGMREDAVLCAFGPPDDVNRSVFEAGGSTHEHKQWVYGRTYIYTENGRVSSWQD